METEIGVARILIEFNNDLELEENQVVKLNGKDWWLRREEDYDEYGRGGYGVFRYVVEFASPEALVREYNNAIKQITVAHHKFIKDRAEACRPVQSDSDRGEPNA